MGRGIFHDRMCRLIGCICGCPDIVITWNFEVSLAVLNTILTVLLEVLVFGRICRLRFQNSTVVIQKAVLLGTTDYALAYSNLVSDFVMVRG
jgi:hypothetical protein